MDCRTPVVDCAVTEWSEWSKCPCTTSSESEKTHRHRSYLDEDAAQTCSEVVEEEENCKPDCSGTLNSSETSGSGYSVCSTKLWPGDIWCTITNMIGDAGL